MSEHKYPSVVFSKKIEEVTVSKGELISVNLLNYDEWSNSPYSHTELWVTPKGEKIIFVPEGVKIESYDNWDELYNKHFKKGEKK